MEAKFAPAERAPDLEVVNLYELLSGVPLLDEILGSVPDVQECRIAVKDSFDAVDLKVSTVPFEYDGELFTICAVQDISHEKRRRTLERTFFHDVLNTAGGLRGYAELLQESEPDEQPGVAARVGDIAENLIEEIETQRSLMAAEADELSVNLSDLRAKKILEELAVAYRHHDVAAGKFIVVAAETENAAFRSDHALLLRVVGNMLKNALEASAEGETVSLGAEDGDDQVEFWVNNPAVMPREVQLQVFKRSFSTKGSGRGIGTYSMRLIVSRYLGGSVDFKSSEDGGTTFRVRLPRGVQTEDGAD